MDDDWTEEWSTKGDAQHIMQIKCIVHSLISADKSTVKGLLGLDTNLQLYERVCTNPGRKIRLLFPVVSRRNLESRPTSDLISPI